jgi:GNAT superfamily N-acetyltransferase
VLAKDRHAGLIDIWAIIDPLFLVAEENGELVGIASINRTGSLAELHKLYVVPSHRRKGIGNALLQQAVKRLRCEGAAELMVETIAGSEEYWSRRAAAYRVNRYGYDRFGIVLGAAAGADQSMQLTGEPSIS